MIVLYLRQYVLDIVKHLSGIHLEATTGLKLILKHQKKVNPLTLEVITIDLGVLLDQLTGLRN